MADFLTAVSTRKVKAPEPQLEEIKSLSVQDSVHIDSRKVVLEALKSQPSHETVTKALKYMTSDGFSLLLPEPLNASIAHQLVNDTIPHYWRSLRNSPQTEYFARILRNPTGIGHIITRLHSLITDSRQKKVAGETRDLAEHIEDLLGILEITFRGDVTAYLVLQDIQVHGKNAMQKKLIWREFLAQTASGRLVSMVAEAEDVLKGRNTLRTPCWLADGGAFADWLGRNIALLTRDVSKDEDSLSALVELYSKALTFGYTGELKLPSSEDMY
jgi:telomere length regulation protein